MKSLLIGAEARACQAAWINTLPAGKRLVRGTGSLGGADALDCGSLHSPLKSPQEASMPETSRKPRIALGSEPRRLSHQGNHPSVSREFSRPRTWGPGPNNRWIIPTTERDWGNPSPTGRTTAESRCAAAGLGIPVVNRALALEMVHVFLNTPFRAGEWGISR